MNRREFVGISLGVLGSLTSGAGGALGNGRRREPREPDPDLLELGLTGMARADNWFDAHWGAGVLAGAYLLAENELDAGVADGIRNQLDVVVEGTPEAFEAFPEEAARSGADAEAALLQALEPALPGGLREHGHAVTYTALALRGLRDAPHMARPKVIDGIERQITEIANSWVKEGSGSDSCYANTDAMVAETFGTLVRFEELVGLPRIRRPNFTHIVTHTEALTRLESLGHAEVARRGHGAHHVHIDESVPTPKGDALDRGEVTFEGILRRDYWEDPERQSHWQRPWNKRKNPNGDWIASGHLFKVLYAFCELARRMDDDDAVQRSAVVVFERYFDPDVLGG